MTDRDTITRTRARAPGVGGVFHRMAVQYRVDRSDSGRINVEALRLALRKRSWRSAGLRQGAGVVRESRGQRRRARHDHLGALYDNGYGVAQDYGKAREWYEKAAAKDDELAMYSLGVLYGNGYGVAQDYGKAREWFENAAAKDD